MPGNVDPDSQDQFHNVNRRKEAGTSTNYLITSSSMVTPEDDNKTMSIEARPYLKTMQKIEEDLKPVQPRPTGWFPLGYKEAFSQWV